MVIVLSDGASTTKITRQIVVPDDYFVGAERSPDQMRIR